MKKIILSLLVILSLFIVTGCNKESNQNTTSKSEKSIKYDTVKIYDKKIALNSKSSIQKMSFMTNKDELINRTSGINVTYVTYEDETKADDIIVSAGATVINVSMRVFEGKTIDEVMSKAPYKRTNKKVGDIEYQYFNYTDDSINGYCYCYNYEGNTYTITFEAKIDINAFIDTFMKNVSFN